MTAATEKARLVREAAAMGWAFGYYEAGVFAREGGEVPKNPFVDEEEVRDE